MTAQEKSEAAFKPNSGVLRRSISVVPGQLPYEVVDTAWLDARAVEFSLTKDYQVICGAVGGSNEHSWSGELAYSYPLVTFTRTDTSSGTESEAGSGTDSYAEWIVALRVGPSNHDHLTIVVTERSGLMNTNQATMDRTNFAFRNGRRFYAGNPIDAFDVLVRHKNELINLAPEQVFGRVGQLLKFPQEVIDVLNIHGAQDRTVQGQGTEGSGAKTPNALQRGGLATTVFELTPTSRLTATLDRYAFRHLLNTYSQQPAVNNNSAWRKALRSQAIVAVTGIVLTALGTFLLFMLLTTALDFTESLRNAVGLGAASNRSILLFVVCSYLLGYKALVSGLRLRGAHNRLNTMRADGVFTL